MPGVCTKDQGLLIIPWVPLEFQLGSVPCCGDIAYSTACHLFTQMYLSSHFRFPAFTSRLNSEASLSNPTQQYQQQPTPRSSLVHYLINTDSLPQPTFETMNCATTHPVISINVYRYRYSCCVCALCCVTWELMLVIKIGIKEPSLTLARLPR